MQSIFCSIIHSRIIRHFYLTTGLSGMCFFWVKLWFIRSYLQYIFNLYSHKKFPAYLIFTYIPMILYN